MNEMNQYKSTSTQKHDTDVLWGAREFKSCFHLQCTLAENDITFITVY